MAIFFSFSFQSINTPFTPYYSLSFTEFFLLFSYFVHHQRCTAPAPQIERVIFDHTTADSLNTAVFGSGNGDVLIQTITASPAKPQLQFWVLFLV